MPLRPQLMLHENSMYFKPFIPIENVLPIPKKSLRPPSYTAAARSKSHQSAEAAPTHTGHNSGTVHTFMSVAVDIGKAANVFLSRADRRTVDNKTLVAVSTFAAIAMNM
jgi:hypothetical protein